MTNQALADAALQSDQARRRALDRGDIREAFAHDVETARLCALLKG